MSAAAGERLPVVRCARAALGAVSADPEILPWPDLVGNVLVDTVTGGVPHQPTFFKCAWDASEFRALFVAVDDDPWWTLSERDAPLYNEEVCEVFLDPVGDLAGYFEFEVNPVNAVLDLVLRRNRSGYLKDFTWRCEGLRTAARLTEEGWCAEFSIPFAALMPAPPEAGARWRGNFHRIDRPQTAPVEYSAWSPTGLPLFHVPEKFGVIEFAGA